MDNPRHLRIVSAGFSTLLAVVVTSSLITAEQPGSPTPLQLFEQRIMPIFRSPKPASCVQCHLSGVDLKDYILPSHEQTFASLRHQGLINLAEPKKSKILTLIDMGNRDPDKGASLIHEQTRKAEYEAFEAWIAACCNDPKLRDLPMPEKDKLARPERPDPVIRHARKSRVVDSFVRNVWSQRMRCFPCHTPHELDPANPNHRVAIQRHKDFMEKDGKAYGDRMNIFRETPEATMQYLIERSRTPPAGELPLIDLKDPRKSLLVLKPTAKLPERSEEGQFAPASYVEPVSHMGGLKMHLDDQSYKSFIAWIQDYARVARNEYASVSQLPADNWYPSKHVIQMRDLPKAWPDQSRVQFFIHAWNAEKESWDPRPVAFTQGTMTPRRIVAAVLFLFGPEGAAGEQGANPLSSENAKLTPGKYLVKVYVDSKGRLAKDPVAMLGEAEYVGQVEIQAKWREGFPQAEAISGKLLKE